MENQTQTQIKIDLTPPIDDLILKVLEASEYQKLDDAEKMKLAGNLEGHFNGMIMESLFNRLSDEEVTDLKSSLTNQEEFNEKIGKYSAQIPDLMTDIEERLAREVEVMRSLGEPLS